MSLLKIANDLLLTMKKGQDASPTLVSLGVVRNDGQHRHYLQLPCFNSMEHGMGSDFIKGIEYFCVYPFGYYNYQGPPEHGSSHARMYKRFFRVHEEVMRDHIKYVVNDSMFAPAFVTKDVDEILKNGYILKTNYPYRFIHQAAQAIRMVVDAASCVTSISRVMKVLPRDAAFVLGQATGAISVEGNWYFAHWSSTLQPHSFFDGAYDAVTIKSMINRDFSHFKAPLANEVCAHFHFGDTIWGGTGETKEPVYKLFNEEKSFTHLKNVIPFKGENMILHGIDEKSALTTYETVYKKVME